MSQFIDTHLLPAPCRTDKELASCLVLHPHGTSADWEGHSKAATWFLFISLLSVSVMNLSHLTNNWSIRISSNAFHPFFSKALLSQHLPAHLQTRVPLGQLPVCSSLSLLQVWHQNWSQLWKGSRKRMICFLCLLETQAGSLRQGLLHNSILEIFKIIFLSLFCKKYRLFHFVELSQNTSRHLCAAIGLYVSLCSRSHSLCNFNEVFQVRSGRGKPIWPRRLTF